MPTITSDDLEEQASLTRDSLMVAEARALDATLTAVDTGGLAKGEDDETAGIILLTGLYSSILGFRAASRVMASSRLSDELRFLGLPSLRLNPGAFSEYDSRMAARAARGYVRGWEKEVAKARRDSSLDTAGARRKANRKMSHRVVMTSATESSEAYNHQRDRTIREAADRYGEDFSRDFVRRWDATLDRRTCDICAGANGSWVEMDGYFFEGTPGSVHPLCRCIESVVPRSYVL